MDLFLYGTLLDPVLFARIAGPGGGAEQPASLADHAVERVEGQDLPMLVARAGALARGRLWRGLSERQKVRLDAYELPFGYDLKPVTVTLADGSGVAAEAYFPPAGQDGSGAPWTLDGWEAGERALTLQAAEEIGGYDPPLSGADLARHWPMIRHRASARLRAAQSSAPAEVRRGGGAAQVVREHGRAGGFFKLMTADLQHETFDGPLSPVLTRDGFLGVDAAIVLPFDPVRDRVLLVEQFRVGPFLRGDPNPWVLEPVAGLIDAGESPEEAAHREAAEEAALRLQRLDLMFELYPSPGGSTDHFYCYLGLADLSQDGTYRGGLAEEHEDLRLHVLPFERALGLIDTGEASAGPLVAMLLWLARHRERLRATA